MEIISVKEGNDIFFSTIGILRYQLSVTVKLENGMLYQFTFEKSKNDKMTKLKNAHPLLWTKYPEIGKMLMSDVIEFKRKYEFTDEKYQELANWLLNHKRIKLKALLLPETN